MSLLHGFTFKNGLKEMFSQSVGEPEGFLVLGRENLSWIPSITVKVGSKNRPSPILLGRFVTDLGLTESVPLPCRDNKGIG